MYYFYSIHHKQSNIQCLSVSTFNPLSRNGYIGTKKHWIKHLKAYNPRVKRLKDLSKDIRITIMHESLDLNVIKQWREYYYRCWNVYENPKFIDYYIQQEIKKNRKNNKATPGYINKQGQHLKNRSLVRECNLRWYNDGYNKNIYVKENTQPKGYVLGRIMNNVIKNRKLTDDIKRKMGQKNTVKVVSPTGKIFVSLTEAARAYGVKRSAISDRIKHNKLGDKGWRYWSEKDAQNEYNFLS
jgi:hypothetical protein